MLNVEFIHPKFLLTWILILFMRIGVFIPFKAQVVAGKAIGRMMHPFMHKLRSTAYSNISHCFPEKKQPQVERLVKRHFEAIGVSFFETANAYYGSDNKIKNTITPIPLIPQKALDKILTFSFLSDSGKYLQTALINPSGTIVTMNNSAISSKAIIPTSPIDKYLV